MEAIQKLAQALTEKEFSNFMTNVIKYAGKDYLLHIMSKSAAHHELVRLSFVWDKTDEGFDYWSELYNRIKSI